MTADRDLPHRHAPHLPDTGQIEATAGRIAAITLVVLLPAVIVAQAILHIIRSIA